MCKSSFSIKVDCFNKMNCNTFYLSDWYNYKITIYIRSSNVASILATVSRRFILTSIISLKFFINLLVKVDCWYDLVNFKLDLLCYLPKQVKAVLFSTKIAKSPYLLFDIAYAPAWFSCLHNLHLIRSRLFC